MIGSLSFWGISNVHATPNNLHIIPETTAEQKAQAAEDVKAIWNATWKGQSAIKTYNEKASEYERKGELSKSFQTWIMNWNTLLSYVVYVMRFLSQIGLLIGGIMILYAGYMYATTIFGVWDANKGKTAIKNAIVGIIIVVASYAIWKGLVSLFL